MMAGGTATPVAEMYSRKEVQAPRTRDFQLNRRVLGTPNNFTVGNLTFYEAKFVEIVAVGWWDILMTGILRSRNQERRIRMVAPLIRTKSILRPPWV